MALHNAIKANPDKCHSVSSVDIDYKNSVDQNWIKNWKSQKKTGIEIDTKLLTKLML